MQGVLRLFPLVIASAIACSLPAQSSPNVFAWGDNTYGQTNVPPDLTNAIAVAAGNGFSMALRADGRIVEWGIANYNSHPVLSNVVFIAARDNRYAVTAEGRCVVWGTDYASTLFLDDVVQVAIGPKTLDYDSIFTLKVDGTVWKYINYSNPSAADSYSRVGVNSNYMAIASCKCSLFALDNNGSASSIAGESCDWGFFGQTHITTHYFQEATNAVAIASFNGSTGSGDFGASAVLRRDGSVFGRTVITDRYGEIAPIFTYCLVLCIGYTCSRKKGPH